MVKEEKEKETPKKRSPTKKQEVKKTLRKTKTQKLEEELKATREVYTGLEDRHLRLMAEFDNYRKRKEREIVRILEYEGEDIIKVFLPVVDDLERVVKSVDGNKSLTMNSVMEGLQMILDKVRKRLAKYQVEPFDSVGKIFDPELHDAILVQESKDHDEKEIIEEIDKGYRFRDRIIRHAKVVVNK